MTFLGHVKMLMIDTTNKTRCRVDVKTREACPLLENSKEQENSIRYESIINRKSITMRRCKDFRNLEDPFQALRDNIFPC